jgi:hypothetical protein
MKLFKIPILQSIIAVTRPKEGMVTVRSELRMKIHRANKNRKMSLREKLEELINFLFRGNRDDYGVVSRRCVTKLGVANYLNYLIATTAELFGVASGRAILKYHVWGTGTTAESVEDATPAGDMTLVPSQAGGVYVTVGTITQGGSGNNGTVTSVATLIAQGNVAITEHAILLENNVQADYEDIFDRSLFAAKNLILNDSIEFTYVLTLQSGG